MNRLLLSGLLLGCAGCATNVALPEIPEYHPASPLASEAPRIKSFDVLTVAPMPAPELPVPKGHQLPAADPNMKGGMDGGHMQHGQHTMPVEGSGGATPDDHAGEEGKHGGTPMQSIKVPTEQRGMGADSTLYHEHKNPDSTSITHPNLSKDGEPGGGPQVWVCPMHPEVTVTTPGGRCPHCDTVLVPVHAAE